jgi:hypothetical protein
MDSLVDPKTAINTAKLLSAGSSFFLAGYCLSFSWNTFPAIYDVRPQVSTPVFKQIWAAAGPIVPPLTILSTATSAYVAYYLPEQRREWTTAAVAMFLGVPWTGLVMWKGITKLQTIADSDALKRKSEQNLEHRQLLIRWVKQNWIAVALQAVSGVVALKAIVEA